jgi:acetate kinase
VRLAWEHGSARASLAAVRRGGASFTQQIEAGRGGGDAVHAVCDALERLGIDLGTIAAVGHRIVHGGPDLRASVRVDAGVERARETLRPLAPAHVPRELAALDATRERFGAAVPQVAVFDTTFHRTLPDFAATYAGPYEWLARGIRRYGFHGINVAYCVERVAQLLGRDAAPQRLAVAHLGNGSSVTAVLGGRSVDTSMGFTPMDGLMMGTRSGAVDPGISIYLMRDAAARGLGTVAAADELDEVLNRRSGLLGLGGHSPDVRDALAAESAGDARARLALEVFTHRAASTLAGLLSSLGGLDALVFTAGIGEHAAAIRERICARLAFTGLALDAGANRTGDGDRDVASEASPVRVFAIGAREEWFIARECARVLSL